jgi:hypothetical protein
MPARWPSSSLSWCRHRRRCSPGHDGTGLLLAPATGQALAAWIATGQPPPPVRRRPISIPTGGPEVGCLEIGALLFPEHRGQAMGPPRNGSSSSLRREMPDMCVGSGAREALAVEASAGLAPRQERRGVAFEGHSAPGARRHRSLGRRRCH